jgi:ferredoxin
MFSGKIIAREIAQHLGLDVPNVPNEWLEFEEVLKSKPGQVLQAMDEGQTGEVFPVMQCRQEIPCDPCASVCPQHLIQIDPHDIRQLPEFCPLDEKNCIACERCVAVCPGLAITLVDFRKNPQHPTVSIPIEFSETYLHQGDAVPVTDIDGRVLGEFPVVSMRMLRQFSRTLIVRVQIPAQFATLAAGIQLVAGWQQDLDRSSLFLDKTEQDTIICRCEHISADQIRALVRSGVRDINQIKAATKATMGSCGGKTCLSLIKKIFLEEGVPLPEITDPTQRPVFVEMPLETLAKNQQEEA